MKNVLFSFLVGFLATVGVAGTNEIMVAAGETRSLTADEVDALGTDTLVKTGEGTLIAGDEMTDFAGDILIAEGIYKATTSNALGTAAGQTYVNGGTLWNLVPAGTGWNDGGGYAAFGNEVFHLAGTGWNNGGAVSNSAACYNLGGRGGITFEGDTRITGDQTFDFRFGTVNFNGHKLTTSFKDVNAGFRLVALTLKNPGDIEVEKGHFEFQGNNTDNGSAAQTIRAKSGTLLRFWNSSTAQARKLVLEDNTTIRSEYIYGTFPVGTVGATQERWSGPVVMEGQTEIKAAKGTGLYFSGHVTSTNGLNVSNGGFLQLGCSTNSITGPILASGYYGPGDNLAVTGGIALVANGAIPTNTVPYVVVSNGQLKAYSASQIDLPDVIMHGKSIVSSSVDVASFNLKSLTKTGTLPLYMFGPVHVQGAADFKTGTVRIMSQVRDCVPGLNWWYQQNVSNCGTRYSLDEVPVDIPLMGIDGSGVGYAYKSWPATSGGNNAQTTHIEYFYTGFIKVPGEEGTMVRCNFASSIARAVKVVIGGVQVAKSSDTWNYQDNINYPGNYKRFFVYQPVEVPAGWQPIFVYMGNYWDVNRGPQAQSFSDGTKWPSNFGIGVDWEGRAVTNSANYVKLQDPGDGSFLRANTKGKGEIEPEPYRLTFDGSVSFGPNVTFDIGDVSPYAPVVWPSLTGLPTITNGEVHVTSSTWTVRPSDFGGPLTVAAGSKLVFAEGTSVSLVDAEDLSHAGANKTRPLIRVAEGGEIVNPPVRRSVPGTRWRVEAVVNGYDLVYGNGLSVVFR